eukprot:324960_1
MVFWFMVPATLTVEPGNIANSKARHSIRHKKMALIRNLAGTLRKSNYIQTFGRHQSYRKASLYPSTCVDRIASEVSISVNTTTKSLQIPHDCVYKNHIGQTPMIEIEPNLYAKLEGYNLGQSNKDRAIIGIIYRMYLDGTMNKNDNLCLVTSGSAARSLILLQDIDISPGPLRSMLYSLPW